MCTYGLNAEEIADAMESADLQGSMEGDFTEETFLDGARRYVQRLRDQGADIPVTDDDPPLPAEDPE